jgi:hypothetical protein
VSIPAHGLPWNLPNRQVEFKGEFTAELHFVVGRGTAPRVEAFGLLNRVLIQKQRISKIRGAWRTNSTLGSASSIQAMTDTSLVGRGLAIFGRSFGIQLYGHLELFAPTQNIEPTRAATSGTPRGTTRRIVPDRASSRARMTHPGAVRSNFAGRA